MILLLHPLDYPPAAACRLTLFQLPTIQIEYVLLANVLKEAELFDKHTPDAGVFDWERH